MLEQGFKASPHWGCMSGSLTSHSGQATWVPHHGTAGTAVSFQGWNADCSTGLRFPPQRLEAAKQGEESDKSDKWLHLLYGDLSHGSHVRVTTSFREDLVKSDINPTLWATPEMMAVCIGSDISVKPWREAWSGNQTSNSGANQSKYIYDHVCKSALKD